MAVGLPALTSIATVAEASPQPVIRTPPPPPAQTLAASPDPGHRPCLGDGTGFVRARIRGALNLDLNWRDADLNCGGEARPDGTGLRVSFAGPGPGGRMLRLVFGVRSAREGVPGKELPTNLTVLMDGGRVFATRGDDKCTLDQLSQRPLPGKAARAWRIEGRGFCVEPANALSGRGRIVVSRFDFAGRIEFSTRSDF
ncbi:MAG TPA: hypothetical protein VMF03_19315 [Steroidobacteraceae bacterium]|nr:hypothetical protein [Steroidobacteraceae bacterium]